MAHRKTRGKTLLKRVEASRLRVAGKMNKEIAKIQGCSIEYARQSVFRADEHVYVAMGAVSESGWVTSDAADVFMETEICRDREASFGVGMGEWPSPMDRRALPYAEGPSGSDYVLCAIGRAHFDPESFETTGDNNGIQEGPERQPGWTAEGLQAQADRGVLARLRGYVGRWWQAGA